jgi:cytochrome c oxidase assembly protein subunit 15
MRSSITPARKKKAVAYWLLFGVFMLVIQILLGGITRLTGSGLSITEWKPILGAIPPLNEQEWQIAFQKYQQIAQYKYLNAHFTLQDFKHIFFWEWFHREWARFGLALVFAVGFIYFLIKKYFDEEMIVPFLILFLLGGLQGAVGWIMVQSGLNDTDLYVSHIRLAIHFLAALLLLCYTLWFALKLLIPDEERIEGKKLNGLTFTLIGVLTLQLAYGAFMAGLKAASVAPTWPTINGAWVPDQIHQYGNQTYSGLNAFVSHPLAVHFIHRGLAYLLIILVIFWFVQVGKIAKGEMANRLRSWRWWPVWLVSLQATLGIFTVINGAETIAGKFRTFEMLALAHQLVATALLCALVANLFLTTRRAK